MECCGPGYSSPAEAIKAPREKLLYTIAIYTGTGIQKPDYLATVDVDPDSPTYSEVIHRLEMPGIGDELHHMGWNACSSCFDDGSMSRKYLILPGVRSNNLHIVDTATDPRAPRLHKVIEGAEIKAKTNLSGPHTVHCLGSEIIISMLGDAKGEAPGGYLHLNKDFEIQGRWENSMGEIKFGYDFWYQPRHNVMVSSEWAAPNTFMPGFDLEEVGLLGRAAEHTSQLGCVPRHMERFQPHPDIEPLAVDGRRKPPRTGNRDLADQDRSVLITDPLPFSENRQRIRLENVVAVLERVPCLLSRGLGSNCRELRVRTEVR